MSKDFKEKGLQRLESSANLVIRIVGSVIFVWLTWYSFRFTQYVVPGGEEIPIDTNDSMIRNILFLGFALTVLFGAFVCLEFLWYGLQWEASGGLPQWTGSLRGIRRIFTVEPPCLLMEILSI